jgi:exopolysaccharide biosynthesis polyprenyl glycosylphosphotransferase
MNKKRQVAKYVIADILAAAIAWSLFFLYRKAIHDPEIQTYLGQVYADANYYIGIAVIPFFWLTLYLMAGTYRRIYRKSRLKELGQTLTITLIGVIIIFFALILDDIVISYKTYYYSFLVLFSLHFGFTYTFRLIITSITARKIHKGIIGFNTVIVGSNGNAVKIYHDIENQERSSGNKFIGFVNVKNYEDFKLGKHLPHLGTLDDLKKIVNEREVEEVIIAIERSEHKTIEKIITQLQDSNVLIKVIPDMQDFLLGSVKVQSIFHTPLIHLSPDLMPPWQQSVKRAMDIVLSIIAMIVLIPVYISTAIGVKLSSKGPVIYSQERIGLRGKPFKMHKFRSMYSDAEKGTPMLSSSSDNRITPFGKFIRKVRLDEIPQFYSVLIGDMSLVGPRPERQYFIDQIVQRAPHYLLLQKVKPGITSWGQVKFGYAENVDEMIERLKYDILYIENMSIAMDIKIMIYTVLIVLMGRGK